MRKVRRQVKMSMAHGLEPGEVFATFDQAETRTIAPDDFRRALVRIGLKDLTSRETGLLTRHFKDDDDGDFVRYPDFLAHVLDAGSGAVERQIRATDGRWSSLR